MRLYFLLHTSPEMIKNKIDAPIFTLLQDKTDVGVQLKVLTTLTAITDYNGAIGSLQVYGMEVRWRALGAQSCSEGLGVILGAQEQGIQGLMTRLLRHDYHRLAQASEQGVLPENDTVLLLIALSLRAKLHILHANLLVITLISIV